MRNARILMIGLAASAALTLSISASAKLAKAGGAAATFRASGPAGMNIDGKTSDVSVGDDGSTITVVVTLSGLKTGIDLRDEHTQKALESDKFPTAEFKIARAALRFPSGDGAESGDAHGTLRLHGQTKDVTVHYEAKRGGSNIRVDGNGKIDMTEFGIKPPSYMGVGVKPTVTIGVTFDAKDS